MRRELDPATVATVVVALAAALLSTSPLGCSYDWEIGALAPDGAGASGNGGTGATGNGGAGAAGNGGAGASGGGAGCGALAAQLDNTRNTAKACTLGAPSQCGDQVVDECGCDSHVNDSTSTDTDEFVAAVSALQSAGCTPSCSMCLLGPGTCLLSNGMGPYCLP